MKGKYLFLFLSLIITACSQPYAEYNPDSSAEIDYIANSNKLVFGTSTGSFGDDPRENFVDVDPDRGMIHLYAGNETNSAGKIAGSEDGISFSFKEVDALKNFKLSANVKVLGFGGIGTDGETTSNGQEGFGLMVRDYVPQYPGYTLDEVKATGDYYAGRTGGSGNTVFIGAVKRGIRAAYRIGVTGSEEVISDPLVISDSSRSEFEYMPGDTVLDYSQYATLEERPDFPLIGGTYKFTLEKNNSGFNVSVVPPAEKGVEMEFFIPEPDCLTGINPDKYYVGFFAARSAEIEVSDIFYSESDSEDDAPAEVAPPEIITPQISIESPATDADGSYKLIVRSNVPGHLNVMQGANPVPGAEYVEGTMMTEPTSSAVEPFYMFYISVYALDEGDNLFRMAFYPDESPTINSSKTIIKSFVVEKRSYFDITTPIYVSPSGRSSGEGTYSSPLDLQTAIDFVLPGQRIVMKNGNYNILSFHIPRHNNGKYGAMKKIEAETRDQVLIDFDKNPGASGAVVEGNYWHISGIHVLNSPDKVKGLVIMGNNNLVEWVKTYNNGDTGLQISGRKTEPKSLWPLNNTIRFCESFNNKDAAMTDADGFAAKLTVGEGNRFEWCISHNNGDDGWDLFTKKETGTIGVVHIENCISYQNGTLMDGTRSKAGRNGFKLGGEGLGVPHVVANCLSFQNGAHGFTSNSNPAVQISDATSFDNGGRFNFKDGSDSRNFTIYDGSGTITGLPATISGLLSLYSDPDEDRDGENRKEDKIELKLPADGFVWFGDGSGSNPGTASLNRNGDLFALEGVRSTVIPLWDSGYSRAVTEGPGYIKRKADGTFDIGDFMKLTASSAALYNVGAEF
ncbi:MAG: hypothetical protein JXR86_10905 [Spirochaetales bacterium]|nr:hypothetical protein [Spirochaetales bacterium]